MMLGRGSLWGAFGILIAYLHVGLAHQRGTGKGAVKPAT